MGLKPKHVLLQQFNEVLYRHNPIGVKGLPSDEYEGEALSILSRFCEAALQMTDDQKSVMIYATSVVEQTFVHWFGENIVTATPELVSELVSVYLASFPSKEQIPTQ
jgi:hypothetical protein